ncbi:MAG: hypothetical protein ACPG32_05255 [Akkermansiaceae bacterium]
MERIRNHIQPLYDSADLLGFALSSDAGVVACNDTMLSDQTVQSILRPFLDCVNGLAQSERMIHRLTIEVKDMAVVGLTLDEGYALFLLDDECDLDASVETLSQLATEAGE